MATATASSEAAEPLEGVCATCERRPAVEGCPTGLCPLCRATAPETLETIRAGCIPPGSVPASVRPDGERCTRCGIPHRHLTPAGWDPAKRFCTGCCSILAAEMDRAGIWPKGGRR